MYRKTSAIGSNGEFQFFGLFFISMFDIISEAQKYIWGVSYIQYGTYLRVYNSHRKCLVLLQMNYAPMLFALTMFVTHQVLNETYDILFNTLLLGLFSLNKIIRLPPAGLLNYASVLFALTVFVTHLLLNKIYDLCR